MAHYAKVNKGIVKQVIVAEAEFFDTFVDTSPGKWIETSLDGSIRKNYAAIGYTYDEENDVFIPPKVYASWTLNETTCHWDPPVAPPEDMDTGGRYHWNEETQQWDEGLGR